MRWTWLFILILCSSICFSLSIVNEHVAYSTVSYITLKDKDVASLNTSITNYTLSSSLYIKLKEKDVKSLNISSSHNIMSSSLYVNILPNKDKDIVIYLDIKNDTYRNFLFTNMKTKTIVNDSSLANIRIIVNNESTSYFGFDTLGLHYGYERWIRPFACLVVSLNGTVYIYGNSVVGIVNGIDLFLLNEDTFLNTDYVLYYDDKSTIGLKRWDLYVQNKSLLFSSLYRENTVNISTVYNLSHRIKHLTSLLSSKYINGTIGNTDTIIFAAGLWGNISGWDDLAFSLVSSGYDVYSIELTGGPLTECESCYNYDFSYLTDYAWPNMIGYISSRTNKNLTYIGHSNGGRVAISSLDRWGNSGRFFDEDGLYDMSSRPIRHLIGVGVPGAFDGEGNLFANRLSINGKNIYSYPYEHISFDDALALVYTNISFKNNNTKISKSLLLNYYNFTKDKEDLQPGFNTYLEKFNLIYSGFGVPTTSIILYSNDEIVDNVDEELIYENINSSDKNRYFLMNKIHTDMPSDKEIQDLIEKRLLKNE